VYVKHRLGLKNNLYSDPMKSVVYLNSSTLSTRIQAQCLLGLELKGVIRLGYKHNVYLD
jgi:hypothetical protein